MSTAMLTRKPSPAAPCGCSGGAAAKLLTTDCSCAGAGCTSCEIQGYVRPRFFAGQLLTEEDLRALSDYAVNKNRLHNRHFMGDGVVCGLQVTCNPCGGGKLVVQPGHALDCCGNDLVLECAVELDAIAMVRDLRRDLLGNYDCGDPCADRKPNGDKLDDQEKESMPRHYCLYLRYIEENLEPVAPYATDEPCGPAGCEFTRIRESVRFELRCRDEMARPEGFISRALACLSDLTQAEALSAALKKLFSADIESGSDVASAMEALLDLLDAAPQLTDCRLRADVAAIPIPPTGSSLVDSRKKLVYAYVRLVRDCVCRAVLPPCPPCDDTGVLLACVKMADCKVIEICNLERKFVLTAPNFRYWFPVDLLGDLFERMCCTDLRLAEPPKKQIGRRGLAAGAGVAPGRIAEEAFIRPQGDKDIDVLLNLVSGHLLEAFGLDQRDGKRLEHIALNLKDVFGAGAFDALLPARVLRRHAGVTEVKETLSGELLGSAAFQRAAAGFDQQQAARLAAAREELHAENVRTAEASAKQNVELRSQLGAVMDRLGKLEGAGPPPNPPDEVGKKKGR